MNSLSTVGRLSTLQSVHYRRFHCIKVPSAPDSQFQCGQKQVYRVLHCQEGELTQMLSTLSDGWKMTQVQTMGVGFGVGETLYNYTDFHLSFNCSLSLKTSLFHCTSTTANVRVPTFFVFISFLFSLFFPPHSPLPPPYNHS